MGDPPENKARTRALTGPIAGRYVLLGTFSRYVYGSHNTVRELKMKAAGSQSQNSGRGCHHKVGEVESRLRIAKKYICNAC